MDYIGAISELVGVLILIGILLEIRNFNKETLKKMADLETAVQGVKDAFAAAVGAITDATTAAADRVIESLKSGVDPTTQIAELEAFKQTVADAGQAEVDKLNAIDTAPTPEPAS